MKKNVAVLMGGFSSEKEISLKSGEVIYENINRLKYLPNLMADSDIEDHLDSNHSSDSESKAHVALEISENTQLNKKINLIER